MIAYLKSIDKTTRLQYGIVLLLIVLAVWSRTIPHPANFTSVGAIALFAGAYLPRKMAFVSTLSAIIISDLIIGLHSLVFVTWGCFAAVVLLGGVIRRRLRAWNVIGATALGSLLFYLVTNFAVWSQAQMYAMNLSGLIQCYYNALPFFRNMLVGDVIYTVVLFGLYGLARHRIVKAQHSSEMIAM